MKKSEMICSVISGIFLVLIFPKFNMGFLAWIALVPLFLALKGKNPVQSFWFAWISGFIYFAGVLYWVVNTMINYGNLSVLLSYLILFMLVVYLSFYVALFGFFLGFLSEEDGYKKWILAPFLWVALEFLRGYVLTGFPWAALGYSQFMSLRIIQFADITGIYGVSFFIVLINSLIFLLTENIMGQYILTGTTISKEYTPSKKVIILLLFLSFSLSMLYGSLKINSYEKQAKEDKNRLKVSVVQGNIDQGRKWDSEYVRETVDIYKGLTMKLSKNRPDLIVWPETAAPFYFQSDKGYSEKVLSLAEASNAPILFGSPARQYVDGKIGFYNRAYLINPEKEVTGMYDKIHLVPFGEYVPLKKFFFFVEKMVEGIGEFHRGEEYSIMDVKGKKFGVQICFEIIFPQYARRLVKNGAQFLVNITNDAWFGESAAPYQHISIVVFRAIENRVPIVRSANTGVSGLINQTGRITKNTEIFLRTAIEGEIIPRDQGITFYTRYGDIVAYFCIIVVFSVFSTTFLLKYRKERNSYR
jgi:apolipoprotein N-acyltransferase